MFKSMKRIIKWAGKYKGRLYLGSVFSFFSSLSTAIPTMAAAYALDKAIAAYWAGNTIESALIWQTLWIIVGSIALNFLLSYLRAVLQESIGYEVAAGQRIHLGDVLKRVPLGYFSKNSVGDILTGVTTELSTLELQGMKMVDIIINGYAKFIAILLCFLFLSPAAAVISVVGVAFSSLALLSDVDLKSYTDTAYHNEELKSLTRYRFDKVRERAKLKQSVSRLVTILFPELEKLVPSLHIASVYALLSEYPGAKQISEIHLTKLTNLLATASKGRYGKDKAIQIRDAARTSIGSVMPAKFLELKHTIKLIRELTSEIDEIEVSIQKIMDELNPPILSIPGVGIQSAAMILAEIGDFSNFESPDKILAYAGCSPSTYQSGKLTNCYAHMEKRGSRYLRYALYNATKYVCHWNPVFAEYLAKKRAEGKHYNVALSHATKKLVRLIYALQKSGKAYLVAA